jgi:hypothetical protein
LRKELLLVGFAVLIFWVLVYPARGTYIPVQFGNSFFMSYWIVLVSALGLLGLGLVLKEKGAEKVKLRFPERRTLPMENISSPPTEIPVINPPQPEPPKRLSIEDLLAEVIKQKIEEGEIEIKPRISLSHKGKYKVLGREWTGSITLKVAPRKAAQTKLEEFTEKKPPEEKVEESEEISLF